VQSEGLQEAPKDLVGGGGVRSPMSIPWGVGTKNYRTESTGDEGESSKVFIGGTGGGRGTCSRSWKREWKGLII